jgi:hypothetical protein
MPAYPGAQISPFHPSQLGTRFADYLVVDGAYSTAPFLHAAGRVGLHVVARLKSILTRLSLRNCSPELLP